jgi:hypothetical protein
MINVLGVGCAQKLWCGVGKRTRRELIYGVLVRSLWVGLAGYRSRLAPTGTGIMVMEE